MAITHYEVDKSKIENIIQSGEFESFKVNMEQELNIKDMEYEICIGDIATNEDGYKQENVGARTKFSDDWSKVETVTFFTTGIKNEIGHRFPKVSRDKTVFDGIVKVYIKFVFLHELIHIQQFKYKKLTKETYENEKKIMHDKRPSEIEANNKAKNIIKEYGSFEQQVLDYIESKKLITNNNLCETINMFTRLIEQRAK